MSIEAIRIPLDPESMANLDELAVLQGSNLSAALASAVRESLRHHRMEYSVFRSTILDYGGLMLDGSVRITPPREVA